MSKKQKPTKDSFIEFYIVWPILDIGEAILRGSQWVVNKLTGAWWCDYCNKYHGRRVHKFTYTPSLANKIVGAITAQPVGDKYVCSLGRDDRLRIEEEVRMQMADPTQQKNIVTTNSEEAV